MRAFICTEKIHKRRRRKTIRKVKFCNNLLCLNMHKYFLLIGFCSELIFRNYLIVMDAKKTSKASAKNKTIFNELNKLQIHIHVHTG